MLWKKSKLKLHFFFFWRSSLTLVTWAGGSLRVDKEIKGQFIITVRTLELLLVIFNRHGVAGAHLQTPLSLIN